MTFLRPVNLIIFLLFTQALSAQIWSSEQKVLAFDREDEDYFGANLDIHGDVAVVGAFREDHDSLGLNYMNQAGSAYIYVRDSLNGWQFLQKIVPNDRRANHRFGNSVAVGDSFVMVGASGAVYVFEQDSLNHWSQTQKLIASGSSGSNSSFGSNVSLRDNNMVAIGAPYFGNTSQPNYGAVYIFNRDSVGHWSQSQLITSVQVMAGNVFGGAVDFSQHNLVVGAPWDLGTVGSAYVFVQDSMGEWILSQKLNPTNNHVSGFFGSDIAVNDSLLVIAQSQYAHNNFSVGAAYVYKKDSTGMFLETQWLFPNPWNNVGGFGKSISLHGHQILIGAGNSVNPGLMLTYSYNSGIGAFEEQRLVPSDIGVAGGFGASCAVDNGHLLVNRYFDWVPAPSGSGTVEYAGSVYFYELCKSVFDTVNAVSCVEYTSPSGKIWLQTGVYSDTLISQIGCDSIIVVNLTIHPSAFVHDSVSSCTPYVSPSGRYVWSSSGIYTDTLATIEGCDSLITTHLKILNNDTVFSVAVCDAYVSPSGEMWVTSGIYQDTLINRWGCDSLLHISLTIRENSDSIVEVACGNYSSPSGKVWQNSGMYSDTILSHFGCDSVVFINLTVNQPAYVQDSVRSCTPYVSPSGRYVWGTSGTYMDTLTTLGGCDSVITSYLEVLQNDTAFSVTACNAYVSPGGSVWTTTGAYQDTLINHLGCDSVLYVNLVVFPTKYASIDTVSCGYYTTPSGVRITSGGNYKDTIQSFTGCDSILDITLTIDTLDTTVIYSNGVLSAVQDSLNYQWLRCDRSYTPILGATQKDYAPITNGSYAVYMQGVSCEDTSRCISIDNVNIPERVVLDIEVFPNPTDGELKVISHSSRITEIRLFSSSGESLFKINPVKHSVSLDLSRLAVGVYFVKISEGSSISMHRVVKY